MAYLVILQWTTFIATVAMICSGIPPSYEVYKTKDASKSPILFFLLSIANAIGWIHYGYLISNFNVLSLNCFGFVLNCGYVLLYVSYSSQQRLLLWASGIIASYFACLYAHLLLLSGEAFLAHLGASCSLVNIVFLLLPLLDLVDMLRSRAFSSVHLPIQLAACLCTMLWSAYGWALGEWNVVVPNVIGAVLAFASLFARIYLQLTQPKVPEKKTN